MRKGSGSPCREKSIIGGGRAVKCASSITIVSGKSKALVPKGPRWLSPKWLETVSNTKLRLKPCRIIIGVQNSYAYSSRRRGSPELYESGARTARARKSARGEADARAHWPALRRQYVGCLFHPARDSGARCKSGCGFRQPCEANGGDYDRVRAHRAGAQTGCRPGLWGCELYGCRSSRMRKIRCPGRPCRGWTPFL